MAIRLKDADSSLGRLVSVLAGAGADLAGLHSQTQAYVGVLDSRFQNLAAALAGVHAESSNYTGTMWGDLLGLTSSLYGNLGSIGAGYNLAAAIAAVPFAVNTPTPPEITSEATCTTAQQIIDSLAVNGRRTIVQAGTYSISNINIGGNDKVLLFQSGVVINMTGAVTIENAQRIEIRGGGTVNTTTTSYILHIRSSSHVQIGATWRNPNGFGYILREYGSPLSRVLFLGMDMETNTGCGFIGNVGGAGAVTDFIIANSRLFNTRAAGAGNGWATRFNGPTDRVCIVDSYFRAIENTVIRYFSTPSHNNVYYARNQIENGGYLGWRTEVETTVSNIWFIDNRFYQIQPSAGGYLRLSGAISGLTATGNQAVGPNGGQWFADTAQNPVTTTGGYIAPPIWEMQ